MARLVGLVLVCLAACGNITRKQEDAGVPDDAGVDAAPDAFVNPPDAALPKEAREVVTGGTRMTGTTYTFDVQIGHPMKQGKTTSGTYSLEGNTAIKP